MRTPTEGSVYERDDLENAAVAVDVPDTFGVPTHKVESMTITMEDVETGERWTEYVDRFGGNWTKVAESRDSY